MDLADTGFGRNVDSLDKSSATKGPERIMTSTASEEHANRGGKRLAYDNSVRNRADRENSSSQEFRLRPSAPLRNAADLRRNSAPV